jgi:parvulin-like peptidyl-prolyl isomerase
MTSEFDRVEEDPKDYTKWIWLGVIALAAVLVAVLWVSGRQAYAGQSVVRAKHILVKFDAKDPLDRAEALKRVTDVRNRLLAGESFSKLARDYSDDSFSSARGGDLGYARKGVYADEFEAYIWTAPVGQLSEIVTTGHGFHLIVVEDRHLSKGDAYERELQEKKGLQPETPATETETPVSAA